MKQPKPLSPTQQGQINAWNLEYEAKDMFRRSELLKQLRYLIDYTEAASDSHQSTTLAFHAAHTLAGLHSKWADEDMECVEKKLRILHALEGVHTHSEKGGHHG